MPAAEVALVDDELVEQRVRETDADRAQFLGLAFAFTFILAGLGDLAGMGSLRHHGFMLCQLLLSRRSRSSFWQQAPPPPSTKRHP